MSDSLEAAIIASVFGNIQASPKLAGKVLRAIQSDTRPLAGVVGFTDSGGHSSVATSEVEHLMLRGRALRSVSSFHEQIRVELQDRLDEITSTLRQYSGRTWASLENNSMLVQTSDLEAQEAKMQAGSENVGNIKIRVANELVRVILSISQQVLPGLSHNVMTQLPPELRQMVYSSLGLRGQKLIFDENIEGSEDNRHIPGFIAAVKLVGGAMASELQEYVHRMSEIEVTSDIYLPNALFQSDNWLHRMPLKALVTRVIVSVREMDSDRPDYILYYLEHLMFVERRADIIDITIKIDWEKWRMERPNWDHTRSMLLYEPGEVDENGAIETFEEQDARELNLAVHKAVETMFSLLQRLVYRGHRVTLEETWSGFEWGPLPIDITARTIMAVRRATRKFNATTIEWMFASKSLSREEKLGG